MDRTLRVIYRMNRSQWNFVRKFWHLWLRVIYSCDIMPGMSIGNDVHFAHRGLGVVINPGVVIGNRVKIGCNVVIGGRNGITEVPIIEDDVQIGAGAIIIGPVRVGARAIIGAGAIVVKDVPHDCIVVGNAARILEKKGYESN